MIKYLTVLLIFLALLRPYFFNMVDVIKFIAQYNGQMRKFEIGHTLGAAGVWHLYIDQYWYGQFIVYKGDWEFRPQNEGNFTPDQIEKMLDKLRIHSPVKNKTMEAAWTKKKADPERNAKIVYAKDAYNANCWVLSTATGKIYTPREFLECNERIDFHRGREVDSVFKIVDPREWLQKSLVNLVSKTNELTIIQKKINDYYDIRPKPKQNNK